MLQVNQVTYSDMRVKQLISEDNYIRLSPKLKSLEQMIAFDASESKDIDMLGKIATDFIVENADKFKKIRLMLLDWLVGI